MKAGDFEIHAPKKIGSFKYFYVHTLKVKRGKKGKGLQNRSTKTRIETLVRVLDEFFLPIMLQNRSTKTRIETLNNFSASRPVFSIVAKAVYKNKD